MHPLFQGILLGLGLSIMVGPGMFTLIQTSIHRGINAAFWLAVGILLSDASAVICCFLGAQQLFNNPQSYTYVGIIGGLILTGIGIYTFRHKVHFDENNQLIQVRVAGPPMYVLKGFILNFVNPFMWIFWFATLALVTTNFSEKHDTLVFLIGTLTAVFSSDLCKVFIAGKLKKYLTPKILMRVNHLIGLTLIACGIILIVRVFIRF